MRPLLRASIGIGVAAAALLGLAYVPTHVVNTDGLEPPLLVCRDGTKVETVQQWQRQRRPQVLELYREHVYGRAPAPTAMRIEAVEQASALGGRAVRRQWRMRYGDGEQQFVEVLMYVPADAKGPTPVFVGLNFRGNHTVHGDPGIRVTRAWMPNDRRLGIRDHRASAEHRGARAGRWPVELLLERGYGLVTAYYGELDPDFDDGFANGVHGAFAATDGGARAGDAWGSIAAWAWGLSRVLDTLHDEPLVDAERVALIGHSRLGKTALWAGAQDERFALVISNDSGCGGAASFRRRQGETVAVINDVFPHWFCANFHRYADREHELPVDQHMLVALIAPRPVYVASAEHDSWADPEGEFVSAAGADPVYRLLGTAGLPTHSMPAVDTPEHGRIGYHVRSGHHDLTVTDWRHYLDFADRHLGARGR